MRLITSFSGAVLAGGASVRMGTDKAFLVLPGAAEPLIAVSRHALHDAGASEVLAIGGDRDALVDAGFAFHPDDHPHEGPLGGLLTALRVVTLPIVVVLTCDLAHIDGATVRALVHALDLDPDADAAIPEIAGRRQVLTAAYRRRSYGVLAAAFESGERSVRRAAAGLRVADAAAYPSLDPRAFHDLDRPEDLPG